MKKLAVALALLLVPAPALAIDFGEAALKLWEKKDAIVETAKAVRKGTQDLTPQEEHYIGRAVAANILARYDMVIDAERTPYLNTVGQTLAKASDRPETFGGYHFVLLRADDEINAFAAPGGFVFITTGLYKSLANEEELAAVLAHEVAHVSLKHGLGAIKSANLTKAFTILGTEAVKEYGAPEVAQLTEVFEGSIDDIVNELVVNGYSQSQEFDADEEAIKTAWRAGYDPSGLAAFLATLRERSAHADEAGFFKTHPPASNRLKKAEQFAKRKKLAGDPSAVRAKRFGRYALK